MSRVQLETRRHSRAAAAWALAGGVGLAMAGAITATSPRSGLGLRLSLASGHALAFGMVGALWLAALLRYLSSQPSRASVRPQLLSLVFVAWNGSALVTVVLSVSSSSIRERGVMPAPFAGSVATLAVLVLVLPVVLRRLSKVPYVALHHLAALVALVVGVGFADLAWATGGYTRLGGPTRLAAATMLLVLAGFVPLAGATMFYAAYDYESYEDRRWPLVSLIAISAAAVLRFASPYDGVNPNSLDLLTSIAGIAVLVAFGAVLRMRWRGGLSYWSERLAFAGVVVLAVCVFFNLEGNLGAPIGPIEGLWAPSFYGGILMWAAGFALMLDARDLPRSLGRMVLWPISLGAVLFPGLVKLSTQVEERVGQPFGRGLRFVSVGLVAIGVIVLAWHLLRRPRLRAVR